MDKHVRSHPLRRTKYQIATVFFFFFNFEGMEMFAFLYILFSLCVAQSSGLQQHREIVRSTGSKEFSLLQ